MIRAWLKAYNAISLVLWLVLSIYFFKAYSSCSTGWIQILLLVQGLGILESLHVILGWVKTSLFHTAIQYLSRMFISLLLLMVYVDWMISGSLWVKIGTVMILMSWTIAESIRYAYYLNGEQFVFQWLRYSAFLVLYPLGVLAETIIMFQSLLYVFDTAKWLWFSLICLAMVLYVLFFPRLYGYLWRQRKIKLSHE